MNHRDHDQYRYDAHERERYRDRDEESQPYGQREPYNTLSPPRRRWGGSTDYGSGGSRYSESQYGQRRYPRDPYGRDFGNSGPGGGDEYREGHYGSGDFGFERGARGEPSFGAPPGERYESPRYFGSGNYGEGGSHFTGGYRDESRYQQQPAPSRPAFKRGPKGYQRSDERLKEDISERLMHTHDLDCSDVSVAVASGKVTLEGTVPERYMKHYIEDLVDACPGVQDIDNRVRVGAAPTPASATSTIASNGGRSRQ